MQEKERRNFERKDCTMPVDMDDYEMSYVGQVRNLGRGGAFVAAVLEERPEIGREVFLTIPYNRGANYLIIKGQVAWVREDGVGVSFMGPANPICPQIESESEKILVEALC